ncbi:precorrin-2 C(20)-methyltransferase [Pseudooceanicola algae]|uniref:Precorrin-2 C(20)-methyltransferase n=1 Tax=Pseudooceanicola algae TaxID=1537215 RepID=A0A418SKU5_9RHOB|nr:precorrin-2 C(20)-methyltransferase [Pseudooceanicola algae]QPM91029.1 Precorrin-2 C(20)-methyltransferase [Pseudooceanicola algae]
MSNGTLYGVGLGPGDPGLITLRAAELIRAAQVLAYPARPGEPSMARAIAAGLIPEGVEEIVMEVPMTPARAPAQAAYDSGADRIAEALENGRDVVCLCEGDPLFYGSFMYLQARLAARFTVQIVPGVTSVSAAAARAGRALVARNQRLEVLPGPLPDDALRARLREGADTIVILKVGRHLRRIRALLGGMGLMKQALYIERATLPGEVILPLADAPGEAPYFSLILITKGEDPWL